MKMYETEIRVRYEETDAMGVVYYANYLVWFEVARTEFLRSIGFSYRKMEEEGYRLMVVDAACQYKLPCRYDDLVTVQVGLSEMRNTSLSFEYKVLLNGEVATLGKTSHVFTDASAKPVRIPQGFKREVTSLTSV